MALPRDIVEKIEQTFSPEDAPSAIELLSAKEWSGRLARCIVFAAKGNVERLKACIQLAHEDYRDAITAGEYRDDERLRDLTNSFVKPRFRHPHIA